jgi:hypothetical protein
MTNTGTPAQNRPSAVAQATAVISDPEVQELERLLEQLLVEHEQLLVLAGSHRAAIAGANPNCLADCVQQQNEVVQRVAELEKRRLGIVARLADKMKPLSAGRAMEGVPDKPTVSWIAKALPEPVRTRLVALAERLRELLARLQKEHAALREASTALAAHMEGLMRQLAKRLSHSGTYGRRGIVEAPVQVVSALDLRS